MDTVVRTAAVGYHQPPAGTAIIDIECRTRCASVSNAARRWISCRSRGRYLSYCSFRRIRRSPPGRALASLPWRPARETEAHNHMGRSQASWTQWRQGCLVSVLRRGVGTHRHGNRVSMSCAHCSQSNYVFLGGHFLYQSPKALDPLFSDTTVQAAIEVEGCAGQWKIPKTRRKSAAFTLTTWRGELWPPGPRPEPGAIT